jgi:hypothetical protein
MTAPADLAEHLTHRWGLLRLNEAQRAAICRRAQIVGTHIKAPTKHLRAAHAFTTLIDTGIYRFTADYLARPHLVETAQTPRDNRTEQGFVDAARIYRQLDEPAARDLLVIAGALPIACVLLAKVGTPQFAYEWDGTRWNRTTTDQPEPTP